MKTLDQRILIPAPPGVVWAYISDISNNPTWQSDCQNVVFLSQRRTGPGVRWRYASNNGGEYVVETTAWYQGFGYEYTFIDGAPFKHSQGRIRLQEIAEGTVVQWTFMYDAGGPLGAFRDLLGLQRRLENEMVESLKTLWKRITKAGAAGPNFEAKSLMRDAPDAEQRSQYKPRYPTAITEPVPTVPQTKPVPPLT
ncbi:MAG: SRPBCC family protein, partial [Burkholderiales bacterium]|nr:SRPBCC family protein [Anaerolineae bacterium]